MLPVKNFYRPDEVAAFLGLSRHTVHRMVQDGRIAGVKLGHGDWRISRESLGRIVKPVSSFPGKL